MPDAITQLKDDHERVEKLFKKYEDTTDRAVKTRRKLVDEIIEELSVHSAIEEQVFYPISRVLSDESTLVGSDVLTKESEAVAGR